MKMLLVTFFVALATASTNADDPWLNIISKVKDSDDLLPVQIAVDDKYMMVKVGYPIHSHHDKFRPTTNLHIFETSTEALKDEIDKVCIVDHFSNIETFKAIRQRYFDAKQGKEVDWFFEESEQSLGGTPLAPHLVEAYLGKEIAEFCRFYEVLVLDHTQQKMLTTPLKRPFGIPQRGHPWIRKKRAAPQVIVARGCDPPSSLA